MWLDGLVELFFPLRCAGCDMPGTLLCERCSGVLPLIESAIACPRCGAPAAGACPECHDRTFSFTAARAVGVFAPPLSDVIKVYKDAGERRLAPVMAGLLAECAGDWPDALDAIVPVPPRPSAIRTRGFDHIGLLAGSLATHCSLPVIPCLVAGDAQDQRGLGRRERARNAEGRFGCVGGKVPGRILLLDDVFTTGATFEACTARLMAAGASEVRVLALARATDVSMS